MEWGPVPKASITPSSPADTAVQHKEEGNLRFKKGELVDALASYRRALKGLEGNASAQATATRLACNLNIAATLIKLHRPLEAIDACTAALVLDPRSAKAFFRRGKARFGLGELDSAIEDLDRALAISPEDAEVAAFRNTVAADGGIDLTEGLVLLQSGDYHGAEACFAAALATAERLSATRHMAHAHSYMGIAFQMLEKVARLQLAVRRVASQMRAPDTAIRCPRATRHPIASPRPSPTWQHERAAASHERHAALAEGLGDPAERFRALSNLSAAHAHSGNARKALESLEAQRAAAPPDTAPRDLCALLGTMSIALRELGEFDAAVARHEECAQLAADIGDEGLRALSFSNLGVTLEEMACAHGRIRPDGAASAQEGTAPAEEVAGMLKRAEACHKKAGPVPSARAGSGGARAARAARAAP